MPRGRERNFRSEFAQIDAGARPIAGNAHRSGHGWMLRRCRPGRLAWQRFSAKAALELPFALISHRAPRAGHFENEPTMLFGDRAFSEPFDLGRPAPVFCY
jgi:hypothetical protein